ncbi:hypothetical protein A6V36_21510 [Paraburkholderia ginsengiterrae]|uniref:Cellulose biosynthesis protein BcsR n=1 Tax=Paraburkholderia ginsengiterrae TaxID=1462993 RepID=A0A1A9NB18_9BURK|nr:cellulose biosynthesis protein BcsP [Paraburkholderia ginsengiterrae]OAJ62527.1 hypothetical protein A6V36_21510 [Paraburkholderia ginsengiterrae]OAJ62652.1 hypothetical protein A6V37_22800 [Paraburkholderia ginsengiterrae]
MSSSSDIEKLFEHFGGDATAYQEIGRENEARTARTRWPLLETLDLTQPAIPAIGERRELNPQTPANIAQPVVADEDTTPKDAASVTRAKAPLFTRSPRRDIPAVVVTAPPTAPSGGSRFGALEPGDKAEASSTPGEARVEAVAPVAASAAPVVTPVVAPAVAPVAAPAQTAPVAPVAPAAAAPQVTPVTHAPQAWPLAAVPPAVLTQAAKPLASVAPTFTLRTQATPTIPPAVPNWAQAPEPARAYAPAPATPTASATPAAPAQRASILGKLFAPAPQPAPQQPAAAHSEAAPLQSLFDRLRGNPAPTSAAPAGAARAAAPNSWLVNGPRRS